MNVRFIRALFAIALMLALFSPAPAQENDDTIQFKTILKGVSYVLDYSVDRVFYTESAWQDFWTELHAGISSPPPLPQIDFSEKMIILTSMGTQPGPNHQIRVERISRVKNYVRVEILETEPARHCADVGIPVTPFHIVEADRRAAVTFRREILKPKCAKPGN